MDAIGDPTEDSTPFNFTLSTLKPRIGCDGTYILKVTDAAGNEAKHEYSCTTTRCAGTCSSENDY